MARYYFPPDIVFLPPDEQGISKIAAQTPFTLWDAATSGSVHTDVVTVDGATTLEFVTDVTGYCPAMRGPDDVKFMWIDIGATVRFPLYSSEALEWLLNNYDGPIPPQEEIDGGVIAS